MDEHKRAVANRLMLAGIEGMRESSRREAAKHQAWLLKDSEQPGAMAHNLEQAGRLVEADHQHYLWASLAAELLENGMGALREQLADMERELLRGIHRQHNSSAFSNATKYHMGEAHMQVYRVLREAVEGHDRDLAAATDEEGSE